MELTNYQYQMFSGWVLYSALNYQTLAEICRKNLLEDLRGEK